MVSVVGRRYHVVSVERWIGYSTPLSIARPSSRAAVHDPQVACGVGGGGARVGAVGHADDDGGEDAEDAADDVKGKSPVVGDRRLLSRGPEQEIPLDLLDFLHEDHRPRESG